MYELDSKNETKEKHKSLVLCSALKCIFIKNFSHLHCNMLDIVNYSFVILYDGGKMKCVCISFGKMGANAVDFNGI